PRRAERELRAERVEAGLRPRDRADHADRRLGRAAREPRGPEGVPGRMTYVLATLGVKALYLTYLWLVSCVASAWLSDRKGYGERPGLITSLLLSRRLVIRPGRSP